MQIINGQPVLEGQSGVDYGFHAIVDWPHILLHSPTGGPVTVTYFGGTKEQDPTDNGETECGERTRNVDGTENYIHGCSLPQNPNHGSGTEGSPIPKLPCGIDVEFTNPDSGTVATFKRYDNGPAAGTRHAADLFRRSSSLMNTGKDLPANECKPNTLQLYVKIINGATHLSPEAIAELKQLGFIKE